MTGTSGNGKIATWDEVGKFVLAGNAYFTLVSTSTGRRFTYRVAKKKGELIWFASVLRGSDNTTDYDYMGVIDKRGFRATGKSRIPIYADSHRAFAWFYRQLMLPHAPLSSPAEVGLEVWHDGRCGRCGRHLTVPESVAAGIGPECAAVMEAA